MHVCNCKVSMCLIISKKILLSASPSFFRTDRKAVTSSSSFLRLASAVWCWTGKTAGEHLPGLTRVLTDFHDCSPPVVKLWAARVKARSLAPPPPRCPAPGSSSVCCRLSGLPGPPSTPGTQWHCLDLDGFTVKYQAQPDFQRWPPSLQLF